MTDVGFGSKVLVYVEDEITRRYLNAVIGHRGKLVRFTVVGGVKTVLGMLEDAARCNRKNVTFGIIDRDYACGDKQGWFQQSGAYYYKLPMHEIENYMLDFDAIAEFTPRGKPTGKSASHWRTIAHTVAKEYLYSIVYNQLIFDVRRKIVRDFPKQIVLSSSPNRDYTIIANGETLRSTDDVVRRFESEHWLSEIGNRIAEFQHHDFLVKTANEYVAKYTTILNSPDDDWKREFPGKEMFAGIANAMSMTSDDRYELARWIGESQNRHNTVPGDIQEVIERLTKEAL